MLLAGSQFNDPANGLLLDPSAYSAFGDFRIGIECRDNTYRLRLLYPHTLIPPAMAVHNDGDELLFGMESQSVTLPSELLCNVHLAIGYVLRGQSNASQMIAMTPIY
ncbi:hypothetical protein V1509DRAFT_632442 [Lipomyces kononenkoae]